MFSLLLPPQQFCDIHGFHGEYQHGKKGCERLIGNCMKTDYPISTLTPSANLHQLNGSPSSSTPSGMFMNPAALAGVGLDEVAGLVPELA